MSAETAPVAVVGAGPVGLVAALSLARQGVPVVVLDAAGPEVRREWRGSTLHPPTLDALGDLGLADAVVAGGVRVERVQYRDVELDAVATFDYAALGPHARFPFRLQFEQYKLLGMLRDAAERAPEVQVRYRTGVTGVEQGDDAVLLHTTADAVRARWVIGADGAHSDLRRCFAVAFDGDTYPTLSLVAATRFPFAHADLAPVSYWTGPLGRVSLIRTSDAWRIAVSTSEPASEPPPGADVPHPTLRAALDRLAGGPGWQSYPIEQHQFYRSHQRVAATFRSGRLVLAGDAAHLTSTTGGMGLNSGVHDAVDLATRLGPASSTRRPCRRP